MIQTERRPAHTPLRLAAWAVVMAALPCAGYLWSVPGGATMAVVAGAAGIAAFAIAAALAWSIESEALRLDRLVREDKDDFAQWKRRVDILSGVVGVLHQDSVDLKKGLLVGEIDPASHAADAGAAAAGPASRRIESETLLALPKYDAPGAK